MWTSIDTLVSSNGSVVWTLEPVSANSNRVSSRYDSAAGFLFQSGTVMRSHTSHSAVHNCVCSQSRAQSREHRTPMSIASLSQLAGDVLHPLVDTTPIGFNAAAPPPPHPHTRFCFYFFPPLILLWYVSVYKPCWECAESCCCLCSAQTLGRRGNWVAWSIVWYLDDCVVSRRLCGMRKSVWYVEIWWTLWSSCKVRKTKN